MGSMDIILILFLSFTSATNQDEEKNVFRILDTSPIPPSIDIMETFYWLQGISHITINSTVKSNTPVQIIWDFKYYKVALEKFYKLLELTICS